MAIKTEVTKYQYNDIIMSYLLQENAIISLVNADWKDERHFHCIVIPICIDNAMAM